MPSPRQAICGSADVRLVVHYNLPKTLEGFYQESGRAGRDGGPARSVLFYGLDDRDRMDWILAKQKKGKGKKRTAISGKQDHPLLRFEMIAPCCAVFHGCSCGSMYIGVHKQCPVAQEGAKNKDNTVRQLCQEPRAIKQHKMWLLGTEKEAKGALLHVIAWCMCSSRAFEMKPMRKLLQARISCDWCETLYIVQA